MIAEVVSLSKYEVQVSRLLSEDERTAMEFFIASAPESHPVIRGTGGFRKARWALAGRGKSGGARIIYFFLAEPGRVYMAAAYAKSQKLDLSTDERRTLASIAAATKRATKKGR